MQLFPDYFGFLLNISCNGFLSHFAVLILSILLVDRALYYLLLLLVLCYCWLMLNWAAVFVSCRPEESPAIPAAVSLLPLATNHASDVLDMPVDPNEPTYCLCHQVSYGEMIGCDNQDVRALTYLLRIIIVIIIARTELSYPHCLL